MEYGFSINKCTLYYCRFNISNLRQQIVHITGTSFALIIREIKKFEAGDEQVFEKTLEINIHQNAEKLLRTYPVLPTY